MLLILGCDSVLGLLLHTLHEVLHVLEGIDLEKYQMNANKQVKTQSFREKCEICIDAKWRTCHFLFMCHSHLCNIFEI